MPLLSFLASKLLGVEPASEQAKKQQNLNVSTTITTTATAVPSTASPTGPQPVPTSAPTPPSDKATAPATSPRPSQQPYERPPYPPVFSERSLRQMGLMAAGGGFLALSILVTRRAIARQMIMSRLKYYSSNPIALPSQPLKRDPLIAFTALNYATLNTMAFGIMFVGGLSWAFNISTLEELRQASRYSMARSISSAMGGEEDKEAEKELVEWMAKQLNMDLPKKPEDGSPASPPADDKPTKTP
ncbi:uncharacterized protein PODANS_1_20000 [Podospora anserina S mat+]|uniref:Altered inheritance of mitochondria protein 11 n=2 Tax=Podospora anserina TaxID=2587412 RepID=B2AUR2_PODAN|nr:uncharacterized protein PODANS_1_20000 [Podospora anserina S mat+]CAP68135.1 unnamed protein product [Podospora anserina S mat+]CDN29917.1 Putative protein of unknown function [Podospora anserina]CDP24389.1 Putative protein of unknown function [Podospora anserina S mat+]